MKNQLLLIIATFIASIAVSNSISAQNTSNGGWALHTSNAKVDIFTTKAECVYAEAGVTMEYENVKFVNKTSAPVTLTYHAKYYYNGECRTCSNDEYKVSIKIPANGSIVASCQGGNEYDQLAIHIRNMNSNNNSPALDKFEFGDISVK